MPSAVPSRWIERAGRQGLGVLCLVGCAGAQAALGEPHNPNHATNRPAAQDRDAVIHVSPFADVDPTDWAYQALSNLIERYSCVAGYPNGTYRGNRAMTRFEAAALLNACLDRVTEVTDELKRLMKEFEKELAILKGRVDGLDARVGELEATQFATTTKLRGQTTFVIGATRFHGTSQATPPLPDADAANAEDGGTSFNLDQQLTFTTSFSGNDQLVAVLRVGNFDGRNNVFGGGGPSPLSQLEVAFQEGETPNNVVFEKVLYAFPIGHSLMATAGPQVGQDDMLSLWPSAYPSSSVLDVLTLNGAPGAYNKNLGAGARISWGQDGFSISANYVAANGNTSNTQEGGIAGRKAGSSGTVQIGYQADQWGVAAIYSALQNANDTIVYGTTFTLDSFSHSGSTSAFGMSGYWQPADSGWIPSISAGWGVNTTTYDHSVVVDPTVATKTLVSTSQSWTLGLNWSDAFVKGNHAGMAVGQPVFATALRGGGTPRDGNYVWEWWYQLQLTDNISITPAVFYLSRPFGQDTDPDQSFDQLGALVKTTFKF